MADEYEDVCVLVPTYNEAATIGDVIDGFHEQGLGNVLVVDGHSTDGTREIAREHGARVIEQSGAGKGSGKGQAVREGIEHVEAPYVLMLDGDGTYRPEDAQAMLEPLVEGRAEHVVGDRTANMAEDAMPRLNRFGNRIINRAFRFIHGRDLGDILSGYRAFTRESVDRFGLTATGFAIETELSVECVKHNVQTEVVPITYAPRPEDSETNLHPLKDGGRIVLTLYQLAKTNNPLFYFGSVGLLSFLAGSGIGVYVVVEWVTRNVSHEVMALGSAAGIILGVQLLIFGVLSDMIVALHREQLRQLRQVERRVDRAAERGDPPAGADGEEREAPEPATTAPDDDAQ
jgi:dolichol-phosphate mannosyltransferase